MAGAGAGQHANHIVRECHVVDVLRERLTSKHDQLLAPVPDGQHEIRIPRDGRHHATVRAVVRRTPHYSHYSGDRSTD